MTNRKTTTRNLVLAIQAVVYTRTEIHAKLKQVRQYANATQLALLREANWVFSSVLFKTSEFN